MNVQLIIQGGNVLLYCHMRMRFTLKILLHLLLVFGFFEVSEAQHILLDSRPDGSPAYSDVVFSPRFLRPESFDIAKNFSATRAEWIYVAQWSEFAEQLNRLPGWVGLTLNSNPIVVGGEGYAQNFDGIPLVAPWMKSWGAKWATTTHPETRKALAQQLERSLAVGARSIQFDDPLLQVYSARFHAGDFNPATQAGFVDWLRRYPNQAQVRAAGLDDFSGQYRDFLVLKHQIRDAEDYKHRFQSFPSNALWQQYVQSTVEDYFFLLRKRLHENSPHPVALSMNLSLKWPDARYHSFFLSAFPDYMMAETEINDTSALIAQAATARSLDLGFAPSIRPMDLPRNRVAIAMLYALGAQPVVPWDVFAPNQPRYFGTVAEFGDLYRFVRAHTDLFDHHEALATVAIIIDPGRFPLPAIQSLTRRLAQRNIPYAFELLSDAKGLRPLTRERLSGYQLVALGLKETELPDSDRALLSSIDIQRVEANSVTNAQLDALSLFLAAPGSEKLRLLPRAGTGKAAGSWVVHVVDEEGGDVRRDVSRQDCRRRIGIKPSTLGIPEHVTASWISSEQHRVLRGERTSDGYLYFSIPDCPVWGVLRLTK